MLCGMVRITSAVSDLVRGANLFTTPRPFLTSSGPIKASSCGKKELTKGGGEDVTPHSHSLDQFLTLVNLNLLIFEYEQIMLVQGFSAIEAPVNLVLIGLRVAHHNPIDEFDRVG